MKYHIRHLTSYDYEDLVIGSHHSAHLCPRSEAYQRVEEFTCTVQPFSNHHTQHQDFHGNAVEDIHIQTPHSHLEVLAESMVELNRPILPDHIEAALNPAYEEWSATCQAQWQLQEFLHPTPLTPKLDALQSWAQSLIMSGQPVYDVVQRINSAIYNDFSYAPGSTGVNTTIDHVFTTRSGVCQDFAHLMCSILRSLGLPVRYVSGYLETLPPPGTERQIGADASHAWVGVYLPGHGWVDFDPTNNSVVGNTHITIAWGRDYADVAPLKGIIQGGGEHEIKVAVDVLRQE